MNSCPFCGHDPYHYVDNGVGMEAVAVTCCDLGIALFSREKREAVTIPYHDFTEIAEKLWNCRHLLDAIDLARETLPTRSGDTHNG